MNPYFRVALMAAGIGSVVLVAGPAFAHEGRTVGDYAFVVGFKNEPVFAGDKSGVEIVITEAGSGDPVVKGVELEVEVQFGDESTSFPVEPDFVEGAFGDPGSYGATFFPTRPGQYAFHITGTVAGQDVDETFTSGPDTFGDPGDPKDISFPVQDPSTGELAERLNQEVPRLEASVEDAADTADSNKTLTTVALIAAGLALVLGFFSLARGRGTA